MAAKMGRPPTENPRNGRVTVRINKDEEALLEQYCNQEGVDRAEAIRRGIAKLAADIKA